MSLDRDRRRELLVVAGEPSGDRAAARVIDALGDAVDGVFGVGGDRLERSGVELRAHIRELTALGLGDSLRRLGGWARTWSRVRSACGERRPNAALLVDNPEFNLPLARVLSAAGIRVVYYIGPQVWAWRPGRLGLLGERTDVVALVLPFERSLYDRAGVRAVFVGHPVLDEAPAVSRDLVREQIGAAPGVPVVALLPGSRRAEIAALARPMIDAGAELAAAGAARPVLAPAPGALPGDLAERAQQLGVGVLPSSLVARDLLGAADAALVTSGTATLEAAVEGVPLAVVYRIGRLSWWVGRLMVDVEHVGLPNLVAGQGVVPELLQEAVNGPALAEAARRLLDPQEQLRQREVLATVRERLGRPGAAQRVADLVRERLR
jgi:lipid-A-disaccharide synthase